MNSKTQKRVVVAMSGGVDSTVAAFLLKQQGYEVIGISLKVWDEDKPARGKTCCSFDDIQDARRVCDQLDIPFYAFNYKKEFEKKVINGFVNAYYEGRTPNPCILCNQHVKFGELFVEAKKLGADFLATGHHARVERDENGKTFLLKGVDASKDQSYVLYSLTPDQLSRILLPVGDYTKEQIRQIADENGLPTAHKVESQDICFIPNRDHAAFIKNNFPQKVKAKGQFVDEAGKVLGEHEGIHHYTVGQRRGLKVAFGERKYVTRLDPMTNQVVLGDREDLQTKGLVACSVNWLDSQLHQQAREKPMACGVKVRYQKDEIKAMVEPDQNAQAIVWFSEASGDAVSPGQSVVFYQGDQVIGGGEIAKSF